MSLEVEMELLTFQALLQIEQQEFLYDFQFMDQMFIALAFFRAYKMKVAHKKCVHFLKGIWFTHGVVL